MRLLCLLLALAPVTGTCLAQSMTRDGLAPSAPAAEVPANYLLTPNDLVEVKVFQEEDMDWTVRVTKDGTINLPLVGGIQNPAGRRHQCQPDPFLSPIRAVPECPVSVGRRHCQQTAGRCAGELL